jgi:hypothetical protein
MYGDGTRRPVHETGLGRWLPEALSLPLFSYPYFPYKGDPLDYKKEGQPPRKPDEIEI